MADYYIDNNETIYASHYVDHTSGINQGVARDVRLGLSDLAQLSGQSTWFINKVRFRVQGAFDPATVGTTGVVHGSYCAGVIPTSLTTNGRFWSLGEFIDVKGWPLKGCFGQWARVSDIEPFNNWMTISATYQPRKSLVLNRSQELVWSFKNTTGKEFDCILSIDLQAKRGE